MSEEIYDKENARLKEVLLQKSYSICPTCGRELDRGDISWASPSTESGTDYSIVDCVCQQCDNSIFHIFSWWPGITNFSEAIDVIESELK